ncbi:Shedu anti-phage system protein SduA domain-containing protein [Liberiplasma polymorphum]|uniref:Shedu anti-phage system protein SduA domain-containing protein n=1 Tax=Liberiplasma polymorphum TaxID=3374570 RepID=UPI0037716892
MLLINFDIKSYNNEFYEARDNIRKEYGNKKYEIKPYFVISNDSVPNVGFYIDGNNVKYQNEKFKARLSTGLIGFIVNLEAAIVEFINEKYMFSKKSFSLHFDESKTYLRTENINEKFREYLKRLKSLSIDFDVIELGHIVSRNKMLHNFKEELIEAMSKNEVDIHIVFKKFKDILSIVLLGVDSTLGFELRVSGDGFDENRVDIASEIPDKPVNLIEIKSAKEKLLDSKMYRNNTYVPTQALSKAIQQCNIQRANIVKNSTSILGILSRSVLIIGNKKEEFSSKDDPNRSIFNFEVIKFNNKDITIMTYDEIIERVNNLIVEVK